ncbi:hypothetical protein PAXINDRAFT_173343 [Paxillus involutus ATCC 200175]|uniref:Uncharacterized protein n=1 Tax=Paxillus involutus ATCC 200175 TaxID=664439 RepID=A0A0C9TIG0_PAXIN|nr:hypothetical protein PAXINDRAFT_173343 [Paxillus involutus ATCC 200175]
MKAFLTLLAVITSLSAYTLAGVHAKCAYCPDILNGVMLSKRCVNKKDVTTCE